MKYFAAISLLVSTAALASASSIPTGVSDGCHQAFTTLDANPVVAKYAEDLANALTPDDLAAITAPTSDIRTALGSLYSGCTDELTSSPNQDVLANYDFLYGLPPFQQALISKDDSGNYCVKAVSTSVSKSDLSTSEGSGSQAVLKPNTDTYLNNDLLFLGYNENTPKESLCTTCLRNILTSYISFESSTPYAPGLNQSTLLARQSTLYQAVQTQCGSSFLQGAVQAAGGLSGGILNGAPHTMGAATGGVSVLLGALTAAMVAAL